MSCNCSTSRAAPSNRDDVSFSAFLNSVHRAVVLGNPGGGKSTLLQKITHQLAVNYAEGVFCGRRVTPFLVVLRDYSIANKERGLSLLQFIAETAGSVYQQEAPQGAIGYLISSGRALVAFDGLDELLESARRRKITEDVESFCRTYPDVPVIVTSREVGYAEAPLNEKQFSHFLLAPFSEGQVSEYAQKWFRLDYSTPQGKHERRITSFLRESATVPDLRSNPLMLGLMCGIYREETYIPRNRPEVYKKCAELLFDRWDRKRDIAVKFRFDNEFRPVMAHLAHWLYADESLKSGASRARLIEKTTEYLLETRFSDEDDARTTAGDFVAFCHGRSWVFTDMGTTADGQPLYQFTHRTFLEYFTAVYLTRVNRTPTRLLAALLPRIDKREWDVVTQLAFHIQGSEAEGATDALLSRLTRKASGLNSSARLHRLQFAARCLDFLTPSSAVASTIARIVLQEALASRTTTRSGERDRPSVDHYRVPGCVGPLLVCSMDNRSTVKLAFASAVTEALRGGKAGALRAAELLLNLDILFEFPNPLYSLDASAADDWLPVVSELVRNQLPELEALARRSESIAIDLVWGGHVAPEFLIQHFGVSSAFDAAQRSIFAQFGRVSLAQYGLSNALDSRWRNTRVNGRPLVSSIVTAIGRAIEGADHPAIVFAEKGAFDPAFFGSPFFTFPELDGQSAPRYPWDDIDADERFYICLLASVAYEWMDHHDRQVSATDLTTLPFAAIFASRINGRIDESAETFLSQQGWGDGRLGWFRAWIERKTRLSAPRRRRVDKRRTTLNRSAV